MREILFMALKDLRLLTRDKGSLFFVFIFPLLMALFFGSIFSSGSGSTGKMKIAVVSPGDSDMAKSFYANLKRSEALVVSSLPLDSAREMVRKGKLVAYVGIQEGESSGSNLFATGLPPVDIGIDPARKAEAGYLQGIVTQSMFTILQEQMTDPQKLSGSIDEGIAMLDSATGLPVEQRALIKSFLGSLEEFTAGMSVMDSEVTSPFGSVTINLTEITRQTDQPQSAWEITFPQSLLWAIIGIAASFAVSIVSERTRGTFVRLLLAPIGRMQILAGKASACFLASISISFLLLTVGVLVFGVRIGNVPGLVLAVVCTAACFSGIMMITSVLGKTEQAVAGTGWAVMLVMSMTGGGMIPLMVLPDWMLKVSHFSPVKWGIYALEGAIWRGFSLAEMALPLGVLLSIGLTTFSLGTIILGRADR